MPPPASLDIVIVSYRSRGVLRECLESIRLYAPRSGHRVCVVDNASDDGTPTLVARDFPEVDLVVAEENLGFGRATNVGILRGSGTYVLALNPDTVVRPGALDSLVRLMETRPDIGICGCRLELEDGGFDHAAKRSFPTIVGALGHFTGLGRREDASGALAQYRAPDVEAGPVDAVNGAFMLMRREALEEVGLFDERYWMYMEDIDLCYRFAQAGWTTWYEPSCTVVHKKGGVYRRLRDFRLTYAFHYGMFHFYRTHYAARRSPAVNGAVYGGIGAKFLLATVRSGFYQAFVPRPATVHRLERRYEQPESRSAA